MTPQAAPLFPAGRYGRRREARRRPGVVPVALAIITAAAVLMVTYRLYTQYGANPYQPGQIRYDQVTDSRVTVTFEVSKPADGTAVCRLQAKDRSGAETGYAEVSVGTGARVSTTYAMATGTRAVLVTILGCDAAPR